MRCLSGCSSARKTDGCRGPDRGLEAGRACVRPYLDHGDHPARSRWLGCLGPCRVRNRRDRRAMGVGRRASQRRHLVRHLEQRHHPRLGPSRVSGPTSHGPATAPPGVIEESFAGKTAHVLDAQRLSQLETFVGARAASLADPWGRRGGSCKGARWSSKRASGRDSLARRRRSRRTPCSGSRP